MQYLISLREANQHLTRYVHAVELGDEIIITRRGKPVAKMVPLKEERQLSVQRQESREKLFALMEKGISLKGQSFNRESLHER